MSDERWYTRVKAAMKQRGMTTAEFAAAIDRPYATVSGWISGGKRDDVSVTELIEFARVLGVDPAEIVPELRSSKSFVKDFIFEDPNDPEWPDVYRVGEFEADLWDNSTDDRGVFWILNVGDTCGGLRVNPGEIGRYLEILRWIEAREQARPSEEIQ